MKGSQSAISGKSTEHTVLCLPTYMSPSYLQTTHACGTGQTLLSKTRRHTQHSNSIPPIDLNSGNASRLEKTLLGREAAAQPTMARLRQEPPTLCTRALDSVQMLRTVQVSVLGSLTQGTPGAVYLSCSVASRAGAFDWVHRPNSTLGSISYILLATPLGLTFVSTMRSLVKCTAQHSNTVSLGSRTSCLSEMTLLRAWMGRG